MNARENPNIPGDVADINLNGVSVPLGDSLRGHKIKVTRSGAIKSAGLSLSGWTMCCPKRFTRTKYMWAGVENTVAVDSNYGYAPALLR
jgi:hypothetical protein